MAKTKDTVVAGALYASKGDDGLWRVIKVLASGKATVFIRLYTNRFPTCPKSIDPSTLTLAMTIEDLKHEIVPIGVGCMPVARRGFLREEKHYLGHSAVTQDELEHL